MKLNLLLNYITATDLIVASRVFANIVGVFVRYGTTTPLRIYRMRYEHDSAII